MVNSGGFSPQYNFWIATYLVAIKGLVVGTKHDLTLTRKMAITDVLGRMGGQVNVGIPVLMDRLAATVSVRDSGNGPHVR